MWTRSTDNVTILYDKDGLPYSIECMVKKEAGGPWDCYQAYNFFGWEAERVVAVIGGTNIIRARTHLSVILVEDHFGVYEEIKKYLQQQTWVWLKWCN